MAELREKMFQLFNARPNLELQLRKLQTDITYAKDWQDRVEFRETMVAECEPSPIAEHSTLADQSDAAAVDKEECAGNSCCNEKDNSSSIELELQSPGFSVKIVPITGEPFDLQVNPTELVQELHQVLMDKEETCQFTCFSLHFNNQHMDNFAEVKSFKDMKQGSTIRVHEEPYTLREARVHVRHVRDLMCSGGQQDKQEAYSGERGCSVSVLDTVMDETGRLVKGLVDNGPASSPKSSHKNGADSHINSPSDPSEPKFSTEMSPGQFVPGSQPLLPMIPPESQSQLSITCLSELSISHWNPVPSTRKLKGDLLYLKVRTLENLDVGITACTRGFYLNRITDALFNPAPSDDPNMSLTLVELLSRISPSFKKNFSLAQKKRVGRNVLTRVPTSVQHWSWVVPSTPPVPDDLKAEDNWLYRLGYEEHILGQTRDWNEEIQSIREMPAKSKGERITKERAMYKTYSDFLSAAIRGAISVIDGNMMPINPGEPRKTHMYIYNNIFFSLGFDVKDHYVDFGGDAAAYVACNHDLKGVKVISEADVEGLYTLGTAVVDYRGYRVACQTIMPGVLDKEQEESVVHGSIDFGKKIVSHDAYGPKLEKIAHELKSRPHTMTGEETEDGKEHLVHVSTECKGIIGNDGRHYLLDLLRLFPPDVNFMPDLEDGEQLEESVRDKGFPRKHPHKLPQLRQELVEAFVDSRYLAFVSHATSMVLQQKNSGSGTSAASTKSTKTEEEANSSEQLKKAVDQEVDLSQKVSIESDQLTTIEKQIEKAQSLAESSLETNNNIATVAGKGAQAKLIDFVKDFEGGSGDAGKEDSGEKQLNDSQKQIVKMSGEVAGSLSEDKFDISFNLDAFSPKVSSRIPESARKALKAERQVIKDACKFLLHFMIPSFVKDCMQDISNVPLDSIHLTDALHSRGINMRYLSHIVTLCQTQKSKHDPESPNEDSIIASLDMLERVACLELICRSAKHVFKRYMQTVDAHCLSDGVALFLNCFVGAYKEPKLQVIADEEEYSRTLFKSAGTNNALFGQYKKNKSKKKANQRQTSGNNTNNSSSATSPSSGGATSPLGSSQSESSLSSSGGLMTSWMHLSPTQLWRQIRVDLKEYYYFELQGDSIDEICLNYGMIHSSLLRTICPKVGIQLKLKNYDFLSTIAPTFHASDVLNLYPVIKHVLPKAKEGMKLLNKGQHYIQQGLLRPGCELITESLHFLNHVYGPIHGEIALCLKLLAHLNYILGDPMEAISHQHKAIMMYERCVGYDSMQTTSEYLRLALYCFCSEQQNSALYLLHRARYLSCVALGEDHPEIATLDTNIGLVLHAMQKFDQALSFLHNALTLNEKHCGKMSLKTALSHHLKACVASCQGDFRSALQYEKEAFNIYKTELGEDNEKTKESSELLKHLTSQAVALQRKINEFSKSSSASFANAALPALFITQPTHKGVLEMLNVINGFFFFHLKKDDADDDKPSAAETSSSKSSSKSSSHKTGSEKKQRPNSAKKTSSSTVAKEQSSIQKGAGDSTTMVNGHHTEASSSKSNKSMDVTRTIASSSSSDEHNNSCDVINGVMDSPKSVINGGEHTAVVPEPLD